ncbi:NADH dehydrogenase [ubiquinone] 1 beta subcomplex subunit 1 [Lates japonicus]
MIKIVTFAREHWIQILVPMGFLIGRLLDKLQDHKLTAFRNKSILYSRELKPGEKVTWE